MITGEDFEGDNPSYIKLQSAAYNDALRVIVNVVAQNLLDSQTAERLHLAQELKGIRYIDHRPLQFFHDCIAAVARHEKIDQGDQDDLKNHWTRDAWLNELTQRLRKLIDSNPQLPEYIAASIITPNPSYLGVQPEECIDFIILSEYQLTLFKLPSYRELFLVTEGSKLH